VWWSISRSARARPDTKGKAKPTDPVWKDEPDQKTYEAVVNETPSGGGTPYLP
jgi:hypothetical protein